MFRISKYTDISYSYTIFFNLISTSLLVHKIIVDVTWRHRESCCDDDYDGPKEIVWVDLESWSWSLLPSDWFLPRILSLNLFLNFSLNLFFNFLGVWFPWLAIRLWNWIKFKSPFNLLWVWLGSWSLRFLFSGVFVHFRNFDSIRSRWTLVCNWAKLEKQPLYLC